MKTHHAPIFAQASLAVAHPVARTAAVLASAGTLLLFAACQPSPAPQTTNTQQSTLTQEQTMTQSTAANDFQLAPPVAGDTVAIIETSLGTIKVRLFPEEAPESVKNMQELAKTGKYVDVPFHRIAKGPDGKNFVIQTGDFTDKNGRGGHSYKGPGTYIPNEISTKLHHLYGALGMARRATPDTNGSQFYFVTHPQGVPFLDGGYTVFGQVYEGLDVLEKIAAVETDAHTDEPLTPVLMKSVTVEAYSQ